MAEHSDNNNDLSYRRMMRARRASRKDFASRPEASSSSSSRLNRQGAMRSGSYVAAGQIISAKPAEPKPRQTTPAAPTPAAPKPRPQPEPLQPLNTADFARRKKKASLRNELSRKFASFGKTGSVEVVTEEQLAEPPQGAHNVPDQPFSPAESAPVASPENDVAAFTTAAAASRSANEEQPASFAQDFSSSVSAPLTAFPHEEGPQQSNPQAGRPDEDPKESAVKRLSANLSAFKEKLSARLEERQKAQEESPDEPLLPPAHAAGSAKPQEMVAVDALSQDASKYERHQRAVKARIKTGIAAAVVLVVVFVLFTVISNVHRSMRITSLDESARILYEAVQTNLNELKASGQPGALVDTLDAHHNVAVSDQPIDFALVNGGSWGATSLYHVGNAKGEDEEVAKAYLLASAPPNLPQGTYLIEFLPEAYEVYAVFYWENDAHGPDQASASDLTYDSLEKLKSRSSDDRKNYLIGYYAGPEAAAADKAPGVNAAVVNGDELFVQLTGSTIAQIASDPSRLAKLEVEVQVTGTARADMAQKVTWLHTYSGDELQVSGGEIAVVLDSPAPGKAFSQVVDTVVPGSNITVRATVRYDGSVAATTNTKANSLFASFDEARGIVHVSSLRHLNNLHATKRSTTSARSSAIKHLVIDGDIEFSSAAWPVGSASSAQVVQGNPLSSFEPLTSFELPSLETVSGGGHELRGFVIKSESENVGLFSTANFDMDGVVLRDVVVHGRNTVGALAGKWQGGTISNCHIRTTAGALSEVTASDRTVGGLVGELSEGATMDSCSSTALVSGKAYVGGLAGMASSDTECVNCAVGYEEDPAHPAQQQEGQNVEQDDEEKLDGLSQLTLEKPVQIEAEETCAGGAFGATQGSSEAVRVLANVRGTERVGGFAGILAGSALLCEVNSPVRKGVNTPEDPTLNANCTVMSNGGLTGGFAGEQTARAQQCYTHVDVIAHGDNVGGFSGLSSASCSGCGVYGMIAPQVVPENMRTDLASNRSARVGVQSNGNNVGGFVGMQSKGDLEGCFSSANVAFERGNASEDEGYNYGGLVGRQDDGKIETCYASGDVGGRASVAGLVGRQRGGTATDVYTCGVIIGDQQVGGVIGYGDNTEELKQCWGWALVYANGKEVDAAEALARHQSSVEDAAEEAAQEARTTGTAPRAVVDEREETALAAHLTSVLKVMRAGAVVAETGSDQCKYIQCAYLVYRGYNDFFDPLMEQPAYYSYDELVSQAEGKELSVKQSHPVKESLGGKAYPFAPLWFNGEPMPHFGNWPSGPAEEAE